MLNEVKILSELSHPNIIKFVDFYEDRVEGFYVIVTELFKSMTIDEFLQKHEGSQNRDLILKQIFEVLEYLHGKLIIHRDFNANNILIDPETLVVKIIDFGLSRSLKEGDSDIVVSPQGNLKYRLPDSLGFSKNPYLCDVWSAGMVAFSIFLKQKVSTCKFLRMIQEKENLTGTQRFIKTLEAFNSLVEKNMEEENTKACFKDMRIMKVFQT